MEPQARHLRACTRLSPLITEVDDGPPLPVEHPGGQRGPGLRLDRCEFLSPLDNETSETTRRAGGRADDEGSVYSGHAMAFPYPFPGGLPRLDNKHAAQVLIDEYKAHGYIKRCAHARLGQWGGMLGPEEFGPECAENSFLVLPDPNAPPYELAEEMFLGCPKDCRFYTRPSVARLKAGVVVAWHLARAASTMPFTALGWLLTWYRQLPAITQIALLVLILLLVGLLKWEQAIQIINAARGGK